MSNVKKNDYISGNYSVISPKVHKIYYSWIIQNYSFFDVKGGIVRSPIFTSATNHECKWYLKLVPNDKIEDETFIRLSLTLDRTSPCNVVFARFHLFILDKHQMKTHSRQSLNIDKFDSRKNDCEWALKKFISKKKLFTDEYLPNDKLTIYCEVTFSDLKKSIDILDQSANIFKHFDDRDFKEDPLEDFERLFKNQDFADIVILVKNKRFQAHKCILAARSPVFAAMFKYDTKESKTNEVEITDIDENVIEEMLYYMYTGKFQNLDSLACDLLKTADKYGMERMKIKCENALMKNLSVENAADILILADLYHASKLKSRTIDFVVLKSTEVMNTKAWNKIISSHPYLINEVCRAFALQSAAQCSLISVD